MCTACRRLLLTLLCLFYQTLSSCVYDHEQLLEPFKLASVSLSARELTAVVSAPRPRFAALLRGADIPHSDSKRRAGFCGGRGGGGGGQR